MKRIAVARISRLIAGWQGLPGTLPQQLGSALGRLVAARELPVGALLPSERALAAALGLSRGTVVAAYGLLRDAQLVASQQGSGYRIVASSNSPGAVHTRLVGEVSALPQQLDMSSGALPASPTLLRLLSGLQGADLARIVSGLGYDAYGLPELRAAVARYYSDLGLATRAEQILITSGAQQAVWLLANALLDASDAVVVEDPSYRGSLEAFRRRNARLLGVNVTPRGLDWQQLERHLQQRPRLAYLFAECHNPTGRSMDQAARQRLVALLRQHDVLLVEDGSQSELHAQPGLPPSPLAALCEPGRVATIGTMSKLFWGGLRVGWVRAEPALLQRLASMKAVNDLGSSRFDQRLALELLESLPEARAQRLAQIQQQLQQAEQLLRSEGGRDWRWSRPDGGTALWIHIPGADMVALSEAAARQGVLLTVGPGYSVSESYGEYLRLPFVRPAQQLGDAVRLVQRLLAEQRAPVDGAPRPFS
ncbi:MAG: PLP-dependent aminotransferase family protein [Acidovorax sp.]|nr:PLP-dependent aminotransferase family protein [Acidovorax sp.]